jgi:hypothetical protein
MTTTEAAAAGFRPLTATFFLKKEAHLLSAVVADMVRGGIEHVLIEEAPNRVAVWRANWIELPNPTLSVVKGIRGARK